MDGAAMRPRFVTRHMAMASCTAMAARPLLFVDVNSRLVRMRTALVRSAACMARHDRERKNQTNNKCSETAAFRSRHYVFSSVSP
jgi:hypothetical protein